MDGNDSTDLCLECGLCCNGVIFADVELQHAEVQTLKSTIRGLSDSQAQTASAFSRNNGKVKLLQPCAAFDGCHCRIYSDRPKYCRQFECLWLKNVQSKKLTRATALRTVQTAKERAEKVRALLRELGDTDEQSPLSRRFQHAAKR